MRAADLREIDHDQWVPFLSDFSQAHFGEPVKVRVLGRDHAGGDPADVGDEPATPLMLIVDQTDATAGERIDVVTGAGRPVSYVVSHPIHVRVSDRSSGQPLVVQIDDEDGSTTVVRFLAEGTHQPLDA